VRRLRRPAAEGGFDKNARGQRSLSRFKTKIAMSHDIASIIKYSAQLYGGDKRDRTADLLNAIQALSQAKRLRTPINSGERIEYA